MKMFTLLAVLAACVVGLPEVHASPEHAQNRPIGIVSADRDPSINIRLFTDRTTYLAGETVAVQIVVTGDLEPVRPDVMENAEMLLTMQDPSGEQTPVEITASPTGDPVVYTGSFTLPADAQPGTYVIGIEADGIGSISTKFVVTGNSVDATANSAVGQSDSPFLPDPITEPAASANVPEAP